MPSTVRKYRIFVASPGDVRSEREILASVVADLNLTFGNETDTILELVRWETHAFPAAGRAQGVINDQLGEYDVFIGIILGYSPRLQTFAEQLCNDVRRVLP